MSNNAFSDTATASETAMLKLVEGGEGSATSPADLKDSSEPLKAPAQVFVRLDSLSVSMLDNFSLIRVFRQEFRGRTKFFRSPEGGNLTLAEAVEKAIHELDSKDADEIFVRLLTMDSESITFSDLHELWNHAPEDAESIWIEMKLEARREFMSGHLASTVFEPVDWMRSAWKRALFLGVRDAFVDEYQPEGGIEIALVDLMAQAHFLHLHWLEEAIKRTRTDPKRHNEEFMDWLRYKQETGWSEIWNPGNWEKLYASELQCQEQALKTADHFVQLFLRAVRQMDNHRLAKAKLRRLSLPKRTQSVIESEHEHAKQWSRKVDEAKNRSQ
jgi:hypothetical protein